MESTYPGAYRIQHEPFLCLKKGGRQCKTMNKEPRCGSDSIRNDHRRSPLRLWCSLIFSGGYSYAVDHFPNARHNSFSSACTAYCLFEKRRWSKTSVMTARWALRSSCQSSPRAECYRADLIKIETYVVSINLQFREGWARSYRCVTE